ncbi:MAG: hypothetical protein R6W76_14950 [Caldilinea sp.]
MMSGEKLVNEEQEKSLRQQIDDAVIDLRNEVIVQGTNTFLLARQLVLTGLGLTFLGLDQIQALLREAVERGEIVESDAQERIEKLRKEIAEGTTAAISSRLSAILNKAPGINVTYKAPSESDPPSAQ